MRRAHGFTLIELLVVIAIIAILAAILFPVFARARAKAQQNNCLSNIKQLSLGTLMYVSDYDDRFPFGWSTVYYVGGSQVGGARLHWTGEIYPYVKNLQLYACPASNTDAYMIPPGGWGPDPMVYADYAMNGCLGAMDGGGGCISGWLIPLKQAAVYRPAEMIMIKATDAPGWFYTYNPDKAYAEGAYVGPNPWDYAAYNPNSKWPNIETRHNNGGNIAFVDGHCKWMSREKLYAFDGSGGWNNTP